MILQTRPATSAQHRQRHHRARPVVGATESLLERTATHTRTVTAAQRRLFSLWLNNPLDAAVKHSMEEFAGTLGRKRHETRSHTTTGESRAAALDAAWETRPRVLFMALQARDRGAHPHPQRQVEHCRTA